MSKLNVIWWTLIAMSLISLSIYISEDDISFLIICNIYVACSLVVVGMIAAVQAIKLK